jgi:hypothetical protein
MRSTATAAGVTGGQAGMLPLFHPASNLLRHTAGASPYAIADGCGSHEVTLLRALSAVVEQPALVGAGLATPGSLLPLCRYRSCAVEGILVRGRRSWLPARRGPRGWWLRRG